MSERSSSRRSRQSRPSYRTSQDLNTVDDDEESEDETDRIEDASSGNEDEPSVPKISDSRGSKRLSRILKQSQQPTIRKSKVKGAVVPKERAKVDDLQEVADFLGRVVIPPLSVHPSSIGGSLLESYPLGMQQEVLLLQNADFEFALTEEAAAVPRNCLQYPSQWMAHKRNLGLYSAVAATAMTAGGGSLTPMVTKHRQKIRYLAIARSSNRPLLKPVKVAIQSPLQMNAALENMSKDHDKEDGDYDDMFQDEANNITILQNTTQTSQEMAPEDKETEDEGSMGSLEVTQAIEDEVSSFPVLMCLTINADGTAPDIRKMIPLDQLTTVQDLTGTVVQLAFSGETIRLDFGPDQEQNQQQQKEISEEDLVRATLAKERFIWSLLQIHAMLYTSVVEQHALTAVGEGSKMTVLSVRNLDRAELQYTATVNNFLKREPALSKLLDRYASQQQQQQQQEGEASGNKKNELLAQRDALAFDLLMGKMSSRVELFHSSGEQKDAEEVLNSMDLDSPQAATSIGLQLAELLQMRMANLEAETCRRLIAWEDEKAKSRTETMAHLTSDQEDTTVDALALASLFSTLESLDQELGHMEYWLGDMAAAIKPLTDDCADIEAENRQLEQQWKSYDLLGTEIRRLLQGLDLDAEREAVLEDPASALVYLDEDNKQSSIDIDASEEGVENIYLAGKALQEAIEYPKRAGGMHLSAVAERTEGLEVIAKKFCTALAQIIVTVMEQFKEEVVAGSDYGKVSKNDTHSMIAKKIRDTQRKFQSSLLAYIKLVEIMAALSPEMLPALRDAYSELVAEGILMKKRCKGYFQALPGRNVAYLNRVGKDLRDYSPHVDVNNPLPLVSAPDIKGALNELLPVIAREAYFVSALFGEATKDSDGREKKRNFENARAAVENASQHFKYYFYRTCGIYSEEDASQQSMTTSDGGTRGDPLLCLVASIYLNEAMDNYIDREKKGGDHSLSLAYVRATILDLRKRADKQWVVWVDKQIDWIRSNEGVPLNGKRAGIFPSFLRFPVYIDHLLQCCKEGREDGYEPDIGGIKVINYYLQKIAATLVESVREAANRKDTDQQYGSNVMLMENTYYFTHSLKARGESVSNLFTKQITKANAICKESTDSYLGWMIKREFVALHELFSRVSKVRKEHGDRELMNHVPKVQFVRTLTKEAERTVLREKIGNMFSRMEKHLSEEGGLLPVAWKALVKVLYEWFGRWEKLSSQLYSHKLDPTAVDVVRIAKAAGGAARTQSRDRDPEFGINSIMALKEGKTQVDI